MACGCKGSKKEPEKKEEDILEEIYQYLNENKVEKVEVKQKEVVDGRHIAKN